MTSSSDKSATSHLPQLLGTANQTLGLSMRSRRELCGRVTNLDLSVAQLLADANVAWLLIIDDLMSPTIPRGALALINLVDREPREGEVYAFHANDLYQIGRMKLATPWVFEVAFDKPGEDSVLVAPEEVEITGTVMATFWNRFGFDVVGGVPIARGQIVGPSGALS